MDGSSGVSAVLDVNQQDGKPQEPHAHAEADAVHCLVAHEHLTVDIGLHARDRGAGPVFTEARDLQRTREGFKEQELKSSSCSEAPGQLPGNPNPKYTRTSVPCDLVQ